MTAPKLNVKLLNAIKRRILREPQKFRMDEWSCGTAHCICGWAVTLSGLKMERGDLGGKLTDGRYTEDVSYDLLGISQTQGCALSSVSEWPDLFRQAYSSTRLRKEKARIAAERIDHFIATKGRE